MRPRIGSRGMDAIDAMAERATPAERLAALAPAISASEVGEHLAALVRVAEGDPEGGPLAALEPSERFGWLAAPSSTIIQASEVHTGLCQDPPAMLDALFTRLVEPVSRRER